MNELFINKIKTRLARSTASVPVIFAAALTVSPLAAQPTAEWPTKAPYDAAIKAFDAALTRAATDDAFRKRLTESSESARKAVAEVGNINIPGDRVIIFYEAEPKSGVAMATSRQPKGTKDAHILWESRSNENIHVFVLPKKSTDTTKTYKYADYFMCCYDYWRPTKPTPASPQ